jgi:hypothetical protein
MVKSLGNVSETEAKIPNFQGVVAAGGGFKVSGVRGENAVAAY